MSAFGTNWLDLSGTSNRYIQAYVKGFVDVSGGNVILRNNNFYVKNGDVSMAGRLFVSGDISSNGNIYVANQITAQPRLFTIVDFSSNLSNFNRLNILNNTYVTGDASFNARLFTTGDVSMAGRVFIKSDVSLNGRLFANFPANSIPASAVVGVATATDSGGQFTTDISGSQRLFVLGDTSLNGNLYVNNPISSNTGIMLAQDPSGQGSYLLNADPPLDFSNNFAKTWTPITSMSSSVNWQGAAISANGQYQTVSVYGGYVYTSNNYGITWTQNATVASGSLTYLSMSANGKYQSLGTYSGNYVYTSSNYGQTWTSNSYLNSIGGTYWTTVAMSANGQYQSTSNGTNIYTSSNYGVTWTLNSAAGTNSWNFIFMSASGKYISVVINGTSIYVSNNYGQSWTPTVVSGTFVGCGAMSANGQYQTAATSNGSIYTSSNYGVTWTPNTSAPSSMIWCYISVSANGQYQLASTQSGTNAQLYASVNYGQTWYPVGPSLNWRGIAMSANGQYLLALTFINYLYRSVTPFNDTVTNNLVVYNDVSLNTGRLYVGSDITIGGRLLITGNIGSTGTFTIGGSTITGNKIIPANAVNYGYYTNDLSANTRLFVVGDTSLNGQLYAKNPITSNAGIMLAQDASGQGSYLNADLPLDFSNNFGTNWTPNTVLGSKTFNGICTSANGQYQTAVVSGGYIYTSSNYGVTWTQQATSQLWRSVSMSANGQYQTAVLFGGYIYTSNNYGVTWTQQATSLNWYSVSISANGQYQTAVVQNGYIWTSNNYGVTWTQQATSQLWRSVSMSANGQYQTAVVQNGYIWTSNNYGVTWTQQATSLNWISVSISANGQYQTAVVQNGYIWTSNNYGVTWARSNYLNWISVSISANGQYQTAVVNGGYIYTSNNYGVTWTQQATSLNWQSVSISANGQYISAVVNGGYVYRSVTPYNDTYTNNLTVATDVSLNTGRLYVAGDVSMNGRLLITGNLTVAGTATVTANIVKTGFFATDISDNARLFVVGDTSLNGQLYVQNTITSNAGIMLAQDASGQGSYLLNADLPLDFSNNFATKFTSLTSTLGSYYWGTSMMSANGQYQVVGDNSSGNVYISNNYGTSWTKAPVNLPYSAPNIPRLGPNAYPPVNFPSSTYSYTASGLRYGNGTYTLSASEERNSAGSCSWAFTTPDVVYNFWQVTYTSNGSTYVANPQGTITTVSGTSYAGAWVQIQMPSSIVCYSYSLTTMTINNPTSWVIAGSTNGTTWTLLDSQTYASVTINTRYTFAMNSAGTSYNYYRFIYRQCDGLYPCLQGLSFNSQIPNITGAISSTGKYMTLPNNTGYISTSNNYGQTWTSITSVGSYNWSGVAMSANGKYQTAIYYGSVNYINISSNSGQTWTAITATSSQNWRSVQMSSSGQYQTAVAQGGYIWTSNNYGQTWTSITSPGIQQWFNVSVSATGQIQTAAITNINGSLYISNDYGQTWSQNTSVTSSTNYLQTNTMSANGQYQIAGMYGLGLYFPTKTSLYVSQNYGKNWYTVSTQGDWRALSVSSTGQYLLAVDMCGNSIYLSVTPYNDTVTNNLVVSNDASFNQRLFISGDVIFNGNLTIGNTIGLSNYSASTLTTDLSTNQRLFVTNDTSLNGNLYVEKPINSAAGIMLAQDASGMGSYILNADPPLDYSNSFATNWRTITLPASAFDIAINATGQIQFMFSSVTKGGYISKNYGISWSLIPSYPNYLSKISISSTGKYMVGFVADSGAGAGNYFVWYSQNYGASWIKGCATNQTNQPAKTAISATGQYMAVIDGVYVYLSKNYGVSWSNIGTINAAMCISISANGQYITVVKYGGWYVSNNYGGSFTYTGGPTNPCNLYTCAMSANGQYQILGQNTDGGYAYFYTSNDYGVTFTQNSYGGGSSSIIRASISADGKYQVLATNGAIFTSTNYGVTWSTPLSSSIQDMAMSSNAQYIIFGYGTSLYRSITPFNDTVANYVIVNNSITPLTTNSINVGGASNLWSTVYANSGTITASDQRLKTNITPSNLGTNFISQLNPVSYKWLEGSNIPNEDGTVTIRPGKRRFYGFLAQDVKQTLDDLSLNDFAGWVLTDTANPDSAQGLRYTEFVSPIIKSIQEINSDLSTTLASINDLSANIHSLYTQTQTHPSSS